MSGDLGAEVVVRAAYQALRKNPGLELLLVGDKDELQGHVTRIVGDEPRLSIVHASEVVEMSDTPVDAMRKKKDSSMRVAIDLVKEQLDYLINSAIVKTEVGEGGAGLDELKGIKIPVRITGSFTDPKIDLQYDELLKALTKEEFERAKAKLKAKAAAEKARLKARIEAEEADARQRLEAEKAAIKQMLEAEQAAAELKLEQEKLRLEQELKAKQKQELRQKEEELKEKLKGLFK
jgi:hypothetical protein